MNPGHLGIPGQQGGRETSRGEVLVRAVGKAKSGSPRAAWPMLVGAHCAWLPPSILRPGLCLHLIAVETGY